MTPTVRGPATAVLALLAITACADSSGGESSTLAGADRADAVAATAADGTEAVAIDAAEEAEVVATLQRLFDALETGDADLLRSVIDASVVMHYAETTDGRTSFGSSTVDVLASRITSSEVPLIERMWDPVVLVHGSLATIWTPYDFYAGSTFSHCGIDSATLMRRDGGWTIVGLSWTRRQPPECDLHPEGPPATGG